MSDAATADRPLLLDLAREAFRRQIAKRVRPLARSFVERWARGEFWLYRAVVQRHGAELRAYKDVVLETLRTTTVDEMLAVCRQVRPELDDLWSSPPARERLTLERERSIDFVESL